MRKANLCFQMGRMQLASSLEGYGNEQKGQKRETFAPW